MRKKTDAAPALVAGIIAFLLSAGIFFVSPIGSVIPLAIFVIICLIAPFFPGTGFFLPVICRGTSGKPGVAVTFDDGPDPRITPLLLQLLSRHNVTATFFVVGANAEKHPRIIKDILSFGHSIGNHTFTHDVLIMLKSKKKLRQEIELAQTRLKQFGVIPLAFRPPAGIVNPRLARILEKQNLFCVTYSCRGPDAGNRRLKNLSQKILKKIRSDDILLLHDVTPPHGSRDARIIAWLKEIDRILTGIPQKGLCVLPLSDIIGKQVMQVRPGLEPRSPDK
jgi:peptidoglycan/xylan/chitin deacetylase (PgdA/CDA1 family)